MQSATFYTYVALQVSDMTLRPCDETTQTSHGLNIHSIFYAIPNAFHFWNIHKNNAASIGAFNVCSCSV
jgi:hypothetical protein